MATQTEIDAACERFGLSKNLLTTRYGSIGQADHDAYLIANAYLALRDPTPITPEGLEAEGFIVGEHDIYSLGELKICRNFRQGEWLIQFGTKTCACMVSRKTMGGVRLAMMQAGGER